MSPEILLARSVGRQPDPDFCFGFIGTAKFLFYKKGFLIEQGFNNSKYVFQTTLLFKFGDALLRIFCKQVKYPLFPFGKGSIGFKVRVVFNNCLAFQF